MIRDGIKRAAGFPEVKVPRLSLLEAPDTAGRRVDLGFVQARALKPRPVRYALFVGLTWPRQLRQLSELARFNILKNIKL
jgi:hypothetical protein